jgi:hypothetical protein
MAGGELRSATGTPQVLAAGSNAMVFIPVGRGFITKLILNADVA